MIAPAVPQDIDAEKSVLGSIMILPGAIDQVSQIIDSRDFFSDRHQTIYSEIQRLHAAGEPATDIVVLARELQRSKKLEEVGGPGYLQELMQAMPNGVHAEHYAGFVREAADRRRLLVACSNAAEHVHDPSTSIEDAVNGLSDRLGAILERSSGSQVASVQDSYSELLTNLENSDEGIVATGWGRLDSQLSGGLRPGQLIVIAARPSVGKSALAANMSLRMGLADASVLFTSLEMKRLELLTRYASALSGVPHSCIARRILDEDKLSKLYQAGNRLSGLKAGIDESSHRTVPQIAATARVWKKKNGLTAIFVDYLQLITAEDRRANREQQVAAMSRGLKILAKDLDVPVICLAQLSREIEKRDNKRPRLSDLRESGAIEQDADIVMFLDRPSTYESKADPTDATIIVAKHRSGPVGEVPMKWHAPTMTFREPREII